MSSLFLRPKKQEVDSSGKMSYGESVRAWNTIRLKKEFVNEFPDLKNRSFKVKYNINFQQSYADLEKKLKKMKRLNMPVPILLLFERDSKNNFEIKDN